MIVEAVPTVAEGQGAEAVVAVIALSSLKPGRVGKTRKGGSADASLGGCSPSHGENMGTAWSTAENCTQEPDRAH